MFPDIAHHEDFVVRSYDVDPLDVATIGALFRWMQEAAGVHAGALGVSMERLAEDGVAWVLNRISVKVLRYPALHERLRVTTWPAGFLRAFATREWTVCVGEEVVARASSAWVIVDIEARRAVRIPKWIRAIETPDTPQQVPLDMRAAWRPEAVEITRPFTVRRSDLDRVGHTNNVHYAEWAAETARDPDATEIAELALNFRAESTYGQALVAEAGAVGDAHHIRIRRVADDVEVALARAIWRPRRHHPS